MSKTDFYRHLSMLFAFAPIMAFAQYKVSGTLTDQQKVPVEFASVLLQTPDSIFVRSGFTDEKGFFELNEKEGKYILSISFLGSVLYRKEISLLQHIELGAIQVEVAQILDEVVVSGEKKLIERRADRIIFNVDQSVYSNGSDALEALSKAPKVYTENNQIQVAGKGQAVVLLNDKLIRMSGEELAQYLKNIPSNDIQKIEVITNPSAKYDAQGAALINIVLKKNNSQGVSGNINAGYSKAKYSSGHSGIGFNVGTKKMSIKTSFGGGLYNFYNESGNSISYQSEDWKTEGSYKNKSFSLYQNLTWNYDVNDNHAIGLNFFGTQNNSLLYSQQNRTDITRSGNIPASYILNLSENEESRSVYTLSTYYTLKIDTSGKRLDFLLDFLDNQPYIKRFYTNTHYNSENQPVHSDQPKESTEGDHHSNNYTFKMDIIHPVKYGEWEYGAKVNLFDIKSSNIQAVENGTGYETDSSRSNIFNYKEWIPAAYVSFKKTIKNIELIAGIRLEYTHLIGRLENTQEINAQKYLRPFPNFLLQYNIKEDQNINIGINSSIDRPFFSYLNPFRLYTNEYAYSTGNPFLQPAYSHELSLEYNHKNLYYIGFYYYYMHNNSEQVRFIDEATKQNYQMWQNGASSHNFGVYQSIDYTIKKKWTIHADAYAAIYHLTSPFLYQAAGRLGWTFRLNIQNDFTLDKNNRFFANLSYQFYAPHRGYKESQAGIFNGIDAGIRMSLLKGKQLSLSVSAADLLRTAYTGYGISPTGERTSYSRYYDGQKISIYVSYKFGKNQLNLKNKNINNRDAERAK